MHLSSESDHLGHTEEAVKVMQRWAIADAECPLGATYILLIDTLDQLSLGLLQGTASLVTLMTRFPFFVVASSCSPFHSPSCLPERARFVVSPCLNEALASHAREMFMPVL